MRQSSIWPAATTDSASASNASRALSVSGSGSALSYRQMQPASSRKVADEPSPQPSC